MSWLMVSLESRLTHVPTDRFYGFTENSREVEIDMKEMVDKVKKGEPLYGTSQLSPYLQGVAARNSRYSQLFIHIIPWFNLVNHGQVSLPLAPRDNRGLPYISDSQNTNDYQSTVSIQLSTISKPNASLKQNAYPRLCLLES
jgi:hypothetical protein